MPCVNGYCRSQNHSASQRRDTFLWLIGQECPPEVPSKMQTLAFTLKYSPGNMANPIAEGALYFENFKLELELPPC